MEMNELNKASIELIINDQVALSIDSDVEIGKQQLQSFHPEAHYYSDQQFRLFKTDAGWNIEHDETAINETIVNGVKLTEPQLIAEGMVITVGNAAKGVLKLPIILKLSICPENTNNLKVDREVVLAAVSNDGRSLEYADDALKADHAVVLAAVSNEGRALQYADDTLKADREVVLSAVSKNGSALEYADDTLKVDREVVLAAVSNDGRSLEYADDALKADHAVVLAAVSNEGWALKYANDALKADHEVILAAIQNNKFSYRDATLDESLLDSVLDELFGYHDIEGFGDPSVESECMEQLIDLANDHYDMRSMAAGKSKVVGSDVTITCLQAIESTNADNSKVRLKFFGLNFYSQALLIAYYEDLDEDEEVFDTKVRFKDEEDVTDIEDNGYYSEFISELEPVDTEGDEDN